MSIRIRSAVVFCVVIFFLFLAAWFFPLAWLIFAAVLAFLGSREINAALGGRCPILPAALVPAQSFAFLLALPLYFPLAADIRASLLLLLPLLFFSWQLLTLLIFLPELLREGAKDLPSMLLAWSCGLLFAYPIFGLGLMGAEGKAGYLFIFLALISPSLSDSAAYLVGSKWGRRALAPRLSAKKSWEGAVAALLGTAFCFFLLATLFPRELSSFLPPALLRYAAFFGFLYSAVAQLGDLAESVLKRYAGIKDSGTLIPGHGGILDRFDSSLATLSLSTVLLRIAFFLEMSR